MKVSKHIFTSFCLAVMVIAILGIAFADSSIPKYQGFGASTEGGEGKPIYHVTNLLNSGPGSLRDAISKSNRFIVFDVGGKINLMNHLYVRGSKITIDGFTAPYPGITLMNYGLIIRGSKGAHDIIVRGIRVRNAVIDGFQIAYGAYNVVLDHVSSYNAKDGNLDITDNSHNVTVSYSIFAGGTVQKNSLIKYNATRVTLHRNLFINSEQRNPQISRENDAFDIDTTVDMRNNVVWNFGYGTLAWHGVRVNIINNYYGAPGKEKNVQEHSIVLCKGDGTDPATFSYFCSEQNSSAIGYVSGNINADNYNINYVSNYPSILPAPYVETQQTCDAARAVVEYAGPRPLDIIDSNLISQVNVGMCD